MSDPAILRFRSLVEAGLLALEERREEVNDLNVFPVADGDTGDNMVLTLRAVLEELDRLLTIAPDRTLDEIGRDEIVSSVARAALLGARGNSGVILSQLIRGAAEELISRPGELVDPILIGAALAHAADQAYASVREPAEGTILTVVREMAHRVMSDLAHMPETRLHADASDEQQDALAADVIERALAAGMASVARGPDLLPVLREAGVVDAGGFGLTIVLAGMLSALRGGEQSVTIERQQAARVTHPQHASTTFRYCTNFAVTGNGLDQRRFIRELEALGDSVLVVGDPTTLKIHVHTDDPETVMAVFTDGGAEVSRIDIADMSEQVKNRDARLVQSAGAVSGAGAQQDAVCGAVAVVTGSGFKDLFNGLGVAALDGGPTLNPSTNDLLAAIHGVLAEHVVLLPNSSNVFMAAERAADLSEKHVVVVPSRSLQAGLAAAVAIDPQQDADANADAMNQILSELHTGAVAQAARDDVQGRFTVGDAVGFVDDELVTWGTPQHALMTVLTQLTAAGVELITCLAGAAAPLTDAQVQSLAPADVELELSAGGQASYWWLLSAE